MFHAVRKDQKGTTRLFPRVRKTARNSPPRRPKWLPADKVYQAKLPAPYVLSVCVSREKWKSFRSEIPVSAPIALRAWPQANARSRIFIGQMRAFFNLTHSYHRISNYAVQFLL